MLLLFPQIISHIFTKPICISPRRINNKDRLELEALPERIEALEAEQEQYTYRCRSRHSIAVKEIMSRKSKRDWVTVHKNSKRV